MKRVFALHGIKWIPYATSHMVPWVWPEVFWSVEPEVAKHTKGKGVKCFVPHLGRPLNVYLILISWFWNTNASLGWEPILITKFY